MSKINLILTHRTRSKLSGCAILVYSVNEFECGGKVLISQHYVYQIPMLHNGTRPCSLAVQPLDHPALLRSIRFPTSRAEICGNPVQFPNGASI